MFKKERVIDSAQGADIQVGGKSVINLCANNYLGLANHPEIVKAARDTDSFSNRYTSVPKAYFKDLEIHPPINLDPPEHTAFRKLLLPEFTMKKASLLEDAIHLFKMAG